MAHARLHLSMMYDWIERCLAANEPTPLDGEICERFGFDSTESARTLLAELADAGRITIRGHRDDRVILLGRSRHGVGHVGKVEPAVRKIDASVERGAARIAEIVRRGGKPARAVVAENAAALLKTVAIKPAQTKPAAPMRKEPVMPAKSIQIPASAEDAIAAIEAHAKNNNVSLGLATASLIKRGMSTGAFEPGAAAAASVPPSLVCDQLRALFASRDHPAIAALTAERDAAVARAEEAEKKIGQMKALFA